MSKLLHKSIGLGNPDAANPDAYQAYMQHFKEAPTAVLRDCLELTSAPAPVPVDQVESAADIMSRFCTGGMSLGAISRESHETIAIAMNRIGGKSNSGGLRRSKLGKLKLLILMGGEPKCSGCWELRGQHLQR